MWKEEVSAYYAIITSQENLNTLMTSVTQMKHQERAAMPAQSAAICRTKPYLTFQKCDTHRLHSLIDPTYGWGRLMVTKTCMQSILHDECLAIKHKSKYYPHPALDCRGSGLPIFAPQ